MLQIKKIVGVLCILGLAVSFSACGGGEPNKGGDGKVGITETKMPTPSPEATPTPTKAPEELTYTEDEVKEFKENQPLIVEYTQCSEDGTYADVEFKNNSGKTIKGFTFIIAQFDNNGEGIGAPNNMREYTISDANIKPDGTYKNKEGQGFPLEFNVVAAKSCVKSVTYEDDSTEINRYVYPFIQTESKKLIAD